MNDAFVADVIATIIKIICLGTLGYVSANKWRQAKRAGENSFAAAWPYGAMIIALILTQTVIWLRALGKPIGWISLGVAGLLIIAAGVGILKQTWHLDRKA
jgi:hypothetical protein